jgi:sugar phosphate isomerase/epimerase
LNRIKRLIEKAERNNVNIAIENVRHPEYLDYVFDNIQSDRLKFCYDSGHENCFTKGINYLEKYGDKLGAMHLHDNNGIKDEHLLPFEGNINWETVISQIKWIGYTGSLAFEIDSQYIDVSKKYTAKEYLAEAAKRGKQLMELMYGYVASKQAFTPFSTVRVGRNKLSIAVVSDRAQSSL